MKILVIEDERELSASIVEFLQTENYTCEPVYDYSSASERISLYDYDCVLLDITLPGGSGLELLRQLKKRKRREGVIIISAKNSIDDRVLGLEIGADDYLSKPFHLAELGARVKALLRRNKFHGSDIAEFGNLRIDFSAGIVFVNDKAVDLTKTEHDLLIFLVSNKNRVVSRTAIGEHLSADNNDRLDSDFVYSHIKNLKKKLAEAGSSDFIKTVYGVGYKFEL